MRFEFKLPDLAEGMVEGEIVAWLVAPGDPVAEEQPVVEVMTDKATVVVSSPRAGKLLELGPPEGELVPVGEVLFVLEIDGPGADEAPSGPVAAVPDPEPAADATADVAAAAVDASPAPAAEAAAPAVPPPPRALPPVPRGAGRVLATPATRRLARELGLDLRAVEGSGPAGRVTKEDVRAAAAKRVAGQELGAAEARGARPSHEEAGAASPARPARSDASAASASAGGARDAAGDEERVPIRGLRRVIFETMRRSKSHAAHFTYVDEVDAEQLVAARTSLKPAAERRGVRLSYLPFIAKAALLALGRFPKMNATVDEDAGALVLRRRYHLGIAAATDAGLTVPVVRDADRLTLLDLAAQIQTLGDRAREGKLTPSDLGGGTFTITSLGKLGGLMATPIIHHPQTAILGVHRLEPRAVVRDGQVVARRMMNLSLSFDHRVIDGHEGAAFAEAVKVYLEDPALMLLEMR